MKSLLLAACTALLLAASFTTQAAGQTGKRQGMFDPNIASEAELAGLPHMNADLAKQLIARRPFLNVADLNTFLGQSPSPALKPEQRAELYAKLFLHLNLNTATREEILLIPGLGNRMLREFLEYRPYKTMAQFRKEIGKYVNAQEVARLEQYVFVPLNLNTASDEDILSIPGLGPRMLREFKEYRPYKTIEQFRKEIGKYVNAKEVARLERYVTLD